MNEPQAPPTPPPPPSGGGAESSNRSIMIVLSYFGPLALIPLLVEKDDKEVQWHAKHGLVLFGAWIAINAVLMVLGSVLAPIGVGCGIWLLQLLLTPIVLVIHIVCMVKGVRGERFLIPGISQFADRF